MLNSNKQISSLALKPRATYHRRQNALPAAKLCSWSKTKKDGLLVEKDVVAKRLQRASSYRREQAIDLYHRRKVDISVVLLDVSLPKIAGLEVILRMKEENPNVKVIVASGYIDPEFKLKMQRTGVQGFIEKPCSPNDVICILRASLESSPNR